MDHNGELQQQSIQPAGEMQPVNPASDVASHVQTGEPDLVPKAEGEHVMAVGSATQLNSIHAGEVQTGSGAPQPQSHESILDKIRHLLHHHTEEAVHEFKTNIAFTPLEIGANETKTYNDEVKRARGEKQHDSHHAEPVVTPPVMAAEQPATPQPEPVSVAPTEIRPGVTSHVEVSNPVFNPAEAAPTVTPIQSPVVEMPTTVQPTLIQPEAAAQPLVSNPPFEQPGAQASNEAQNVVPFTSSSPAPAAEPGVNTQPAVQNPAA